MKKIILISIIFLINAFSNVSIAQSKLMNSADFSKGDKNYFDVIGKEFIANKENSYWFENSRRLNEFAELKAFLKTPNNETCFQSESCIRKKIYSKIKFKVMGIVSTAALSTPPELGEFTCEKRVLFCYYKLEFLDKDIAYMQVINFNDASSPLFATSSKKPALLQITPISPNKDWLADKKFHDKFFRKLGVREGFTQEDVLKSQWGKPFSKTHSISNGLNFDVWLYRGGILEFKDGYVTSITTTSD